MKGRSGNEDSKNKKREEEFVSVKSVEIDSAGKKEEGKIVHRVTTNF